MIRLLASAFVLWSLMTVAAVTVSQPPESTDAVKRGTAKNIADNQERHEPAENRTPNRVSVVVEKLPDETEADSEKRKREIAIQENISDYTRALAYIAGLTLLIIAWQAVETRRAVTASNRSIQSNEAINKILHQQWLDASEWSGGMDEMLEMNRPEGGATVREICFVDFVITNNTSMPLTLEYIEVIGTTGALTIWVNHKLGPEERYPVRRQCFFVPDSTQMLAIDTRDGTGVLMVGRIHFVDAFKDKQISLFGRRGTVGRTGFQSDAFQGDLVVAWERWGVDTARNARVPIRPAPFPIPKRAVSVVDKK